MALNVKAAMTICLGFVATMSWLLHGIEPPQATVPSPLRESGESLAWVLLGEDGEGDSAVAAREDETWSERFAQPNVFEREQSQRLASARGSEPTLMAAVMAPQLAVASLAPPRMVLPPLAFGEPTFELVSAVEPPREDIDVPETAVEDTVDETIAEEVIVADAADTSPEPEPELRSYRVRKGDTLVRISRREWDSDDSRLLKLLLDLNPKLSERPNRILVGEALMLPDDETVRQVVAGDMAAMPEAAPAPASRGVATDGYRWYTIRQNDSLTSIARRYLKDGRRWREIAALNGRLDPDHIIPGHRIRLPKVFRVAAN